MVSEIEAKLLCWRNCKDGRVAIIFYYTKQTIDRHKLDMLEDQKDPIRSISHTVIEKEKGDRLLEWGGKLFYFDRRKSIQLVNFASKFTIIAVDIKKEMFPETSNLAAHYMMNLYSDDKTMQNALERMFEEHQLSVMDRLKDRSCVATLNYTQRTFLGDGDALYYHIRDGVLHTMEINHYINFEHIFTRRAGKKTEYFQPGILFREMMIDRFG